MRFAHYAPLIAAAVLSACGSSQPAPIAPLEYTLAQGADNITLPLQKDVAIGNAILTFTGVLADSRCPTNVTCVWSGDAVAAIAVHPGCYRQGCKAASRALHLHTHLDPRSGEGWGLRVQLLAITPEPVAGRAIDPSTYAAIVRVTPVPSGP